MFRVELNHPGVALGRYPKSSAMTPGAWWSGCFRGRALKDQSACALIGSSFPFEPSWLPGTRNEKWLFPSGMRRGLFPTKLRSVVAPSGGRGTGVLGVSRTRGVFLPVSR